MAATGSYILCNLMKCHKVHFPSSIRAIVSLFQRPSDHMRCIGFTISITEMYLSITNQNNLSSYLWLFVIAGELFYKQLCHLLEEMSMIPVCIRETAAHRNLISGWCFLPIAQIEKHYINSQERAPILKNKVGWTASIFLLESKAKPNQCRLLLL
jgi:hypothetical protein